MTITLREHLRRRGQNFSDIRVLANINKDQVRDICGVHIATVNTWKRRNAYPEWAYKLVGYHAGFFIWDNWEGWYIDDGLLYHPEYKDGFSPQEVAAIGYYRTQLNHFLMQGK
jgi:hypothetical protein